MLILFFYKNFNLKKNIIESIKIKIKMVTIIWQGLVLKIISLIPINSLAPANTIIYILIAVDLKFNLKAQ